MCENLNMENTNERIPQGIPQPRPDSDIRDVVAELGRIVGRPVPCPICGATEWVAAPRQVDLHIIQSGSEPGGALHTLALFCSNCWFIRLHGIHSQEPNA